MLYFHAVTEYNNIICVLYRYKNKKMEEWVIQQGTRLPQPDIASSNPFILLLPVLLLFPPSISQYHLPILQHFWESKSTREPFSTSGFIKTTSRASSSVNPSISTTHTITSMTITMILGSNHACRSASTGGRRNSFVPSATGLSREQCVLMGRVLSHGLRDSWDFCHFP